jgi:hypothetical protein
MGRRGVGLGITLGFFVGALASSACLKSVCQSTDKVCVSVAPDGGQVQCLNYLGLGVDVCAPVATAVMCAGVACSAGDECCQATGRCFAPADRSAACPAPPAPTDGGPAECSSSLDCGPLEACFKAPTNGYCVGRGVCGPRDNCGYCFPEGSERCSVCGCDGVTYASTQAACVAGVRTTATGFCGSPSQDLPPADGGRVKINCGLSSQCPSGMSCCGVSGECFEDSQPWRCAEFTADGGLLDCNTDRECAEDFAVRFCFAATCGGPGRCQAVAQNCGGEVQPVCGCNGVTYTNSCWASKAGVRVATSEACDAG